MVEKVGWERDYQGYEWAPFVDTIIDTDGDGAYVCFVRKYTLIGDGLCQGEGNAAAPNYSTGGQTLASCQNACDNEDACIGYSFYTPHKRCAIWVQLHFLPDYANWEE
eukprot:UN29557